MISAPPGAPTRSGRKGLWLGLGFGCLGLAVLGLIGAVLAVRACTRTVTDFAREAEANPARAAAELAVRFSPEIEKVSEDQAAGEMTIRVKRTGEEITLSYEDLKQGRFRVRGADGSETQIGPGGAEPPAWVPRPRDTKLTEVFSSRSAGRWQGSFALDSGLPAEELVAFFKEEAIKDGFTVTSLATAGPSRILVLDDEAGKRQLNLALAAGGKGRTLGTLGFRTEGGEE